MRKIILFFLATVCFSFLLPNLSKAEDCEEALNPYFKPISESLAPDLLLSREGRKILVIGDLDATWENFYEPLIASGFIDENLNWLVENAYVIQMGDANGYRPGFRGKRKNDTAKIWHAMLHLQRQARFKKSGLVTLIGNHELLFLESLLYEVYEAKRKLNPESIQPFIIHQDKNPYDAELYNDGIKVGDTTTDWKINLFSYPEEDLFEGKAQVNPLSNLLLTPKGETLSVLSNLTGLFHGMLEMWKLAFSIPQNGMLFTHAGLNEDLLSNISKNGIEETNSELRRNLEKLIQAAVSGVLPSKEALNYFRRLNSGGLKVVSPVWNLGVSNAAVLEQALQQGIKNLIVGHHHRLNSEEFHSEISGKDLKVFYTDATRYPRARALLLKANSNRFQVVTSKEVLPERDLEIVSNIKKDQLERFHTALQSDE